MKISIDNGLTFIGAEELDEHTDEIGARWDAIAEAMDDETRERVHAELAPCSEIDFLRRYLELAPCDLVIG